MADVLAFRGIRFRSEAAGDLGRLIAPPYDAASPEHFARLRALSPHNIVHLEQAVPDDAANRDHHAVAAAGYRAWRQTGILAPDARPALYVYEQEFTHDGRRVARRALFAAVRLAAWEERIILPHEETFPAPRLERLNRLRAVRANLSPIYLLYQDAAGELRRLIQSAAASPPDVIVRDPAGEIHRLTVLDEPAAVARIEHAFAGRRLYVADGHHRYEAALAYRDECRAAAPSEGHASHEFILAALADASDPGMLVLPTHRLLHGLPDFSPARLRDRLAPWVDLRPHAATAAPVPASDRRVIATVRFAGETGSWQLRRKPGDPHTALLPPDRSAAWRGLDVAVLGSVVFRHLLDVPPELLPEHLAFAHDAATAEAAVARGEAQAAFLLRPTALADLMAVADAGDRMPPKSTYFHPKIPAGLVLHDVE